MKSLASDADRAEILRRLHALRPDNLRRWGRMNVHQMVCHLADAFRFALGALPASHDAGLFNRTVMKWFALAVPLPWPPGIGTRPEFDQVLGGGTRPDDFQADVAELEALMERFIWPENVATGTSHPIFGAMTREEWLRWGYLHMDHHLRQFSA